MLNVSRLVEVMEEIAPTAGAEAWDNVGLLVGDPQREVEGPVVLTIDLTEPVAEEALGMNAGAIVAYHPLLFHPIKRITACDGRGRSILALLEAGVTVYSPHTALDAVEGGVTDWLIDQIVTDGGGSGMGSDRRALTPLAATDSMRTHKVVAFVPVKSVASVREAMAAVGAGMIGAYRECSFTIPGHGTFFAGEGANPRVGEKGRLETVDEIRLEMVCGAACLADVVGALRDAHPYEEPAFDVYRLEPAPGRATGAGRAVTLDAPATPDLVAERVKRNLGLPMVKLALASEKPVMRVGAVPGAGASLLDAAIDAGCELFVTGEMRHHEVLAAVDRGCSIILAGHTNTERGYLPLLRERMVAIEPGFDVRMSAVDRGVVGVV